MRKLALLLLCCVMATGVLADTNWNVESGVWSNADNWDNGVPDGTNGYINIRKSATSVCTLNTDEGLLDQRWIMSNGQTLNIENGGHFGAQWSRVGRYSAAYINLTGNGAYTMNNDDLYLGEDNGSCVWTMSDTSSLTHYDSDSNNGEEFYVGHGGTGFLQLNGSGLTIDVDRVHIGDGHNGTLEYVMDAGGASTITSLRSYLADNGAEAHLLLSATDTLPEEDIVLIEATSGYGIGGNGIFDTMNGGTAAEGTIIIMGDNVYSLTYTYEANSDGYQNDVALVYLQTAKFLASEPDPANGSIKKESPTTLSWVNPDPNDGVSEITCTVYFGIFPADPNRTGMDSKTLAPNANSVEINAANFPKYGAQPIEDVNDFYWVVDCDDASLSDPDLGKPSFSWSFSTSYNVGPIVSAGDDQLVYGDGETYPTVNLEGSASDPDSGPDPLEVEWIMVDGPETAVINTPDDTSTTVTVTESGVYVFELTAFDGMVYVSDTVQVIVGIDSCETSYLNGSNYNSKDFDHDCDVDILDLTEFVDAWLDCTDTLEGCY